MTVEPGVYLPDRGGVRIEDTLVVADETSGTHRNCSPGSRRNWRSCRRVTHRGNDGDFKNGLVLVIDGQLWQIVEFQHVKPGKGPAFVRTKLKNVVSGKVVDKTYNAGVKWKPPPWTAATPPTCIATAPTLCSWTARTTSSTTCRSRWSATPQVPAGRDAGAGGLHNGPAVH
ncbi:elongation factor P (EF-P) KOW-like domain protein [Mycobacterium xenopi 4042]|uniref:Elongation factor P (EF-P) KOW-like domain protein n=1 Tax=Mycobacterium xenopi 4042 TaxID=1299334 RepID=X7ZI92_MYCXE|nr:elongation factor P (EF-P) KOW-like domain protein [Mycobacterium xenopi 4042]